MNCLNFLKCAIYKQAYQKSVQTSKYSCDDGLKDKQTSRDSRGKGKGQEFRQRIQKNSTVRTIPLSSGTVTTTSLESNFTRVFIVFFGLCAATTLVAVYKSLLDDRVGQLPIEISIQNRH
ncbi:hypothetical protein CHUAL_013162 [Chamberlinius hualienensis]